MFQTEADAALDGVRALLDAGLEHFDTDVVHVSVSKSATYRKPSAASDFFDQVEALLRAQGWRGAPAA